MSRRTIAIGTACLVISLTGISTAYAELIAVAGPVSTLGASPLIIVAPPDVLDDCVAGSGQFGFDEAQGVKTPAAFSADNGVTIPKGTRVDSHMIFLNQADQPGGGAVGHTGVKWTFKRPIIAVMSDVGALLEAASTFALGAPGTNYTVDHGDCTGGAPFPSRGLDTSQAVGPCPAGNDCYTVSGRTITVDMYVFQPGDWIRVVTAGAGKGDKDKDKDCDKDKDHDEDKDCDKDEDCDEGDKDHD